MPKDAPLNSGALLEADPVGPRQWVSEMQAKLHRWAAADPGRRFDDLFNLVHDPATLIAAFDRVAGNRGARTPGADGLTAADVEERFGVPGFLDDLRAQLRQGSFRPLPVRERKIPKPGGSGKVRRLGIPVIADRVVQAALKLVLEPIFETDFKPVSYGFRPKRRAQDAIAEIHFYGTHGYRWVLDADIAACFDEIDHVAHAVAKRTFSNLDNLVWWRVIRLLQERHHWNWSDVRRRLTTPTGRWLPISAGEIELRKISAIPVTRYRYRGNTIPSPWATAIT